MVTPRDTYDYLPFALPGLVGKRRYVRSQEGFNGDKIIPLKYNGFMSHVTSVQTWQGEYPWYVAMDAGNTSGLAHFMGHLGVPPEAQPYYNRAYERFKEDAIGDQSSLGVFAAEWKESLGMINTRALGLYQAARDLRRGDFGGFVEKLGVKPKKKHRRGLKPHEMSNREVANQASGLWLEYWFGWAPMLNDMFTAGDNIQQPLPGGKAYGSAGGNVFVDNSTSYQKDLASLLVKYKIGAEFALSNPNLFLLNRLGLANPAQVAWELVPFSFVADWVTDFGSYLSSLSDWVGLEQSNPWVTCFCQGHDVFGINEEYSGEANCKYFALIRKTDIPRPLPNLQITANLGKSLTRSATAVSLLTQTLLGMSK
jgi:hypothetical protein